jgi:8-amino-7-oxononanoate synthase
MSQSSEYLQSKLQERKDLGLLRSLQHTSHLVDFASNDYLGLAQNNLIHLNASAYNSTGATGSRLISGNSFEAEHAEKSLAYFFGFESGLIFNSGYHANIGLFSCIANKEDVFVSDELVHASIIDGMRLSHAKRYKFKHNSCIDLDECLSRFRKQHAAKIFVVVESVYSMDGDIAPLKEMIEICIKHQADLIVDEAHAGGIFGEYGKGFVAHEQLQDKVFACVYTFGKAYGLHGAMVTGNAILKDYLINFSRPFIYSTALPPHSYEQIESIVCKEHATERKMLLENIEYFNHKKNELPQFNFLKSNTQIQALIIGNNELSKEVSNKLNHAGIFCKAILSPTVATGTERLRICLHAYNTKTEIDLLFNLIQKEL